MKNIPEILILAGLSLCSCASTRPSVEDIIEAQISLSPSFVQLDDMIVVGQITPYTCGISTLTNICNYLKKENIPIRSYIKKHSVAIDHGVDADSLLQWLASELPSYSTQYYSNIKNIDVLRYIHESLKNGIPAIVAFGAPNIYNRPYYDFHFSTIYGMDLGNETITISNAYGYIEVIPLLDFQKRMLYSEIDRYPEFHKMVIRKKAISQNQVIILSIKRI